MTAWYVRPDTSHNTTRNGLSYETAWGGWAAIVWGAGGVQPGDTLYVCGSHASSSTLTVGAHGASNEAGRVTIRGDYPGDSCSITFTGNVFFGCSRSYTTLFNLRIVGGTSSCVYTDSGNYITVDYCELSGGNIGINIGHAVARIGLVISNNDIHDFAGVVNSSGRGILMLVNTASLTHSNIQIYDNHIYNCPDSAIRLSIESVAWNTTTFDNLRIYRNIIHDCGAFSIWARSGNADKTTIPVVYSKDLYIGHNVIDRCGTVAGNNGAHGGIAVSGFSAPCIVENNTIRNVYTQGAAIQTAKNDGIVIRYNDIRSPRSGTQTASFQSGLPIDGNGIFLDNLTVSGKAYRNYIEDCVTTGLTNSGTGLAFWNGANGVYHSNVVVNCYRGGSYGDSIETGNAWYNNTFINCDIGITKIGTQTLTGNVSCKNNLFVGCEEGFVIGANPGIDEDYNVVYGAATAYTGISKGANSLVGTDPLLHPTTYAPQSGSPCIGAGVQINPGLTDYNGRRFRSGAPSIGAIEARPRVAVVRRVEA